MKEIQTFSHEQFGDIRICQSEGREWFCLSDVCKALEISNTRNVKTRLQERGVCSIDTPTYNQHGTKVMQPMTYINEPNVYRCIFQSRKQEAEQFQNWVFDVVLPQIRQTGGYIPVDDAESDEQVAQRTIEILKRTLEDRNRRLAEQQATMHEQVQIIAHQRRQLRLQQPRVDFANALAGSPDSILMRDLAKLLTQNGYTIGQNRLFRWMRQHGYIFKNGTRPIQRWVEKGLFDTSIKVIQTNRTRRAQLATRVTAKGQQYFLSLLTQG